MKPYYYSIISAAVALSALSSCKQYDEVNPRTCQAATEIDPAIGKSGLQLFNDGQSRATKDNKTKYDEGYKAGNEGLTEANGFADGKAVIYKQKYDAAYAAAYTPAYNAAFTTNYNNVANYNQGYSVGQSKGQSEGIANGNRDGANKGYNDAKANADYAADADAKEDGYYYGASEGNADGIADGKYHGAIDGAEQGAADGYDDGYADGYEVGAEYCDLYGSTYRAQEEAAKNNKGAKIVPPKIEDISAHCEKVGYDSLIAQQANYNQGYADGKAANTQYQAGYAKGLADAETIATATKLGNDTGKATGEKEGASAGATKRYNEGYTAGYNATYTPAYNTVFNSAVSTSYWANYPGLYTSFYNSYYDYYYEQYYTAAYNPQYNAYYNSYFDSAYASAYDPYYDSGYDDGLDDADYNCDLAGGRKAATDKVARLKTPKTITFDGQKVVITEASVLSNRIQVNVVTGVGSNGKKVVVSSTASYPVTNFKNAGGYGLGKYQGVDVIGQFRAKLPTDIFKSVKDQGSAAKASKLVSELLKSTVEPAVVAMQNARQSRLKVNAQVRQDKILTARRARAEAKYNESSSKWPELVRDFRRPCRNAGGMVDTIDCKPAAYKFHWERK